MLMHSRDFLFSAARRELNCLLPLTESLCPRSALPRVVHGLLAAAGVLRVQTGHRSGRPTVAVAFIGSCSFCGIVQCFMAVAWLPPDCRSVCHGVCVSPLTNVTLLCFLRCAARGPLLPRGLRHVLRQLAVTHRLPQLQRHHEPGTTISVPRFVALCLFCCHRLVPFRASFPLAACRLSPLTWLRCVCQTSDGTCCDLSCGKCSGPQANQCTTCVLAQCFLEDSALPATQRLRRTVWAGALLASISPDRGPAVSQPSLALAQLQSKRARVAYLSLLSLSLLSLSVFGCVCSRSAVPRVVRAVLQRRLVFGLRHSGTAAVPARVRLLQSEGSLSLPLPTFLIPGLVLGRCDSLVALVQSLEVSFNHLFGRLESRLASLGRLGDRCVGLANVCSQSAQCRECRFGNTTCTVCPAHVSPDFFRSNRAAGVARKNSCKLSANLHFHSLPPNGLDASLSLIVLFLCPLVRAQTYPNAGGCSSCHAQCGNCTIGATRKDCRTCVAPLQLR